MAAIGLHLSLPPSSLGGGSQGRPERRHLSVAAGRQRPSPRLQLKAPQVAIAAGADLHLALAAPSAAGDLSVLIPISAVLLVFYWVANFVVPEMISKDLQASEPNEDILEETNAQVDEKLAMPSTTTGQPNKLGGVKSSKR